MYFTNNYLIQYWIPIIWPLKKWWKYNATMIDIVKRMNNASQTYLECQVHAKRCKIAWAIWTVIIATLITNALCKLFGLFNSIINHGFVGDIVANMIRKIRLIQDLFHLYLNRAIPTMIAPILEEELAICKSKFIKILTSITQNWYFRV